MIFFLFFQERKDSLTPPSLVALMSIPKVMKAKICRWNHYFLAAHIILHISIYKTINQESGPGSMVGPGILFAGATTNQTGEKLRTVWSWSSGLSGWEILDWRFLCVCLCVFVLELEFVFVFEFVFVLVVLASTCSMGKGQFVKGKTRLLCYKPIWSGWQHSGLVEWYQMWQWGRTQELYLWFSSLDYANAIMQWLRCYSI